MKPNPVLLSILLAAVAFAGPVGTPYRGPDELRSGAGDAPGTDPAEFKAKKLDGAILWQFHWEHNKDRYLARATRRGRIAAGSAYFWFGGGAKYPPREIAPVSGAQRRTAYAALAGLVDPAREKDPAVRAEACIALGRLASLPGDGAVARTLVEVLRRETGQTPGSRVVRESAILALGMSGDGDGCAHLLESLGRYAESERACAHVAFGLARYAPALPTLVKSLPRRGARNTASDRIAAIHALGLFGAADGGVQRLPDLVSRTTEEAVVVQAVTALGRLGQDLGAVRRALGHSSKDIRWAALWACSWYDADAKEAAKLLIGKGYRSGDGQSKNFAVLALGELAARLDPNDRQRSEILRFLRDECLDSRDNYVRACAAVALGCAEDRAAIPAVAALLRDTTVDDNVIGAACLALGLLRATEYATDVREFVLEQSRWNADARGYALLGTALMGDTSRSDDLFARGALNVQTERQLPLALGVLGEGRHVPALTAFFSRDWDSSRLHVVSNAAFGLAWNRDGAALGRLVALTRSGSASVRGMAAIALGYVAARDRVSPLARCYENVSHRNRFGGWDLLRTISRIL